MNDFSKQDTKLYRGSVFRKDKGLLTKQVKERKKEARQKRDVQLKKIKSQTNWKGNRADKIKEVKNKYYDTLDKIKLDREQYEDMLDKYGPLAPASRSFMTPKKIKKKDPYAEGTGIPSGQKGTPPPSIFKQKKKKIKKKGGGMTGEGLYPAEEARSGTMSQAKRKKYMKKGGKITYRMTGGQVVASSYD